VERDGDGRPVSRNTIHVPESPATVFAVLDDALAYPRWVVGTRAVLGVDPAWPAPGTSFRHEVGTAAAQLHDRTTVIDRHPPRELVLRARFRPTGVAVVTITVEPDGPRSRVTLEESPESGPVAAVPRILVEVALHLRNRVALRRLRREVARRAHLLT
jgi:uncharacterized protein YndB with AHSA1/START domain